MENKSPSAFDSPPIHTLDTLSELEFNKMMAKGLAQAKANQGVALDDALNKIKIPKQITAE